MLIKVSQSVLQLALKMSRLLVSRKRMMKHGKRHAVLCKQCGGAAKVEVKQKE